MKNISILFILFVSAFFLACEDDKLPEVTDSTDQYKSRLSGEWKPVEQRVNYYKESYKPGYDTTAVFTETVLTNSEGDYFNGLYNLRIRVSSVSGTTAQLINLKFEENRNYQFGDEQLAGARWHVTDSEGTPVINFMKKESEASSVMQVERLPYTIISLSSDELVVGTMSDAQESVFTGTYNITTGLPVSSNRWCSHTIVYKKVN